MFVGEASLKGVPMSNDGPAMLIPGLSYTLPLYPHGCAVVDADIAEKINRLKARWKLDTRTRLESTRPRPQTL